MRNGKQVLQELNIHAYKIAQRLDIAWLCCIYLQKQQKLAEHEFNSIDQLFLFSLPYNYSKGSLSTSRKHFFYFLSLKKMHDL